MESFDNLKDALKRFKKVSQAAESRAKKSINQIEDKQVQKKMNDLLVKAKTGKLSVEQLMKEVDGFTN